MFVNGGSAGGERTMIVAGYGAVRQGEQPPFSVYCDRVVRTRVEFENIAAAEMLDRVDGRDALVADLGAITTGNVDFTIEDIVSAGAPPIPE